LYLLFSLARKVAKEHTAIQERSFLSALLPFETALGIGSRRFFISIFAFAKIIPIKYSLPPQHTQSQAAQQQCAAAA
jgi:hypothetical protein